MNSLVSVIIPAHNEANRIGVLLARLNSWARKPEVIVVADGCTDATVSIAKLHDAKVIALEPRLGPDVGRAIGLTIASGNICVVIDADILIYPRELEPFVQKIELGADLALNAYPYRNSKPAQHPTAIAKAALNQFLRRPDLGFSSLTTVPHALSRKAIDTIPVADFMIPPVAQARAILSGLVVAKASFINVGSRNRAKGPVHHRQYRDLIIGDCLEAIHLLLQERGTRGGFTDLTRRRRVVHDVRGKHEGLSSVAIIPVRNEQSHLRQVMENVRISKVKGVYVISNGTTDKSLSIAKSHGALTSVYKQALGHDVGRAVGCKLIRAKRYVFLDGDIPVPVASINRMLASLENVDVSLNNLDLVLRKARRLDSTSIVKRFLNIAVQRPDLGISSLTAIPHAMTAKAIRVIGPENLVVPPLAHAKAILSNLKVSATTPVNVVSSNAFRFRLHSKKHGRPLANLILGDHLEALSYVLEQLGPRAGFTDTLRSRTTFSNWYSLQER